MKLSPGARAISEARDRPMGLRDLWKKYGVGSESIGNARAIAKGAGSSGVWFSRISRGLGLVPLAVSFTMFIERISSPSISPNGNEPYCGGSCGPAPDGSPKVRSAHRFRTDAVVLLPNHCTPRGQ